MAVKLEYFSIIIPRNKIDSIYPGGSDTLILDSNISEDSYDENLIRFGAEDSLEIGAIIEEWIGRGLRDIRKRKGKRVWIDLCLIDPSGEPTLPCKWIKIENNQALFVD